MPSFKTISDRLSSPGSVAGVETPALVGSSWGYRAGGDWSTDGDWPSWGRTGRYNVARHDLSRNSVVLNALAWLRRNIHMGRYVVGNEEDDGTYTEVAHPLTMIRGPDGSRGLLRKPNPYHSWRDTLGATSDCLAVTGNAFWLKARRLGELAELYWVPNHRIEVEGETDVRLQGQNGLVRCYWYTSGTVRTPYRPQDVVHFRTRIDPLCYYMGLSDLQWLARSGASVEFAERATSALLRNLRSSGLLVPREGTVYEGSLEEEAMIRASQRIEGQGSGENLGRIPNSTVPMDYVNTGFDVDQLGLQWILDWPVAILLACFGLNMLVLGYPGAQNVSTFANKKEAKSEAWENGVIPLQDAICAGIEDQVLSEFDSPKATDCWVDRRDVEALQEDANDRAARARILRPEGPLGTLNETRSLVDLPEVEGGDRTPVEEAAEAAEQAAAIASGQGAATDPEVAAGESPFSRNGGR